MKNAKIVAIAPTVAARRMADKIITAQKFDSVEKARQRKNAAAAKAVANTCDWDAV